MKRLITLLLVLALLLTGCKPPTVGTNPNKPSEPPISGDVGGGNNGGENNNDGENNNSGGSGDSGCAHSDSDDNGVCDGCELSVLTAVDFYTLNDLHGKFDDTDSQPGVDELTTYLRVTGALDEHAILLSTGDMWQGSSESNATAGMIMTDWMNELDFAAMALGNHEFDWGEEAIINNAEIAEFPLLAINIFDRATNERVEYAESSVTVECGELTVGIIGAIGDCYSSISPDKVEDVYFKVGYDLTELVMAESERLRREESADLIVYILHDGYGSSVTGTQEISTNKLDSYYDIELSDGYVDLVFEGHSHQRYVLHDRHGVYHLQGGGENKGISHVEMTVNFVTGTTTLGVAEFVSTDRYADMPDDPAVDSLLEKYADKIEATLKPLGINKKYMYSSAVEDLVARLYYEFALEEWGDEYNIVLGGGYLNTRSPYDLKAGEVTYADLWAILPFDNTITLCSVKGSDLLNKFINTSNSNYHIYPTNVGSIDRDATYYIVTDSYTALYAANRLTVVEDFGPGLYARDLLAEYIKAGGLE